jgi:putative heme-binding domain-containing protein
MGPDLTTIGMSRSAEYLRQSILDPGAGVQQRYWVVRATDVSGKNYEGFLMNEDTYTLQIIEMSQRLHSLDRSSLQALGIDKTSKMPSYQRRLSEEQVNQLVAYLSSLRPRGGTQ